MRFMAVVLAVLLWAGTAWAQAPETPGTPDDQNQAVPSFDYRDSSYHGPEGSNAVGRRAWEELLFDLGYLMDVVELSREQLDRICAEAKEKLIRINELEAELENNLLSVICVEKQEKIEEKAVKDLYVRTGQIQADIFLARRTYLETIKSILNEEQIRWLQDNAHPHWGRRY